MNKRLANIVKEAISQDDIASRVVNETPKAKTKQEWKQWSDNQGFDSHEYALVLMYARKFGLLIVDNKKTKSEEDIKMEQMRRFKDFVKNPD